MGLSGARAGGQQDKPWQEERKTSTLEGLLHWVSLQIYRGLTDPSVRDDNTLWERALAPVSARRQPRSRLCLSWAGAGGRAAAGG